MFLVILRSPEIFKHFYSHVYLNVIHTLLIKSGDRTNSGSEFRNRRIFMCVFQIVWISVFAQEVCSCVIIDLKKS